ncbi:MAG: DNA repair protein RecO [Patescibacteria group bacterium]|nr:DNA repair protein RecO [Patescibacteria group bacterium]MDE1945808.1 DNA repair protein RecO [Patescibacteria group bacterium]
MHHVYTTRAIVVRSRTSGEANRAYDLLTEGLGFIRALAQGVRLAKSKLKGHLRDFCLVSVSVVRGRDVWRITSAEAESAGTFFHDPEKMSVAQGVLSLLLRLVHGEEKNERLFRIVRSFLAYLASGASAADARDLEILAVLRILATLGYLKESAELSRFVGNDDISDSLLAAVRAVRKTLVAEINETLLRTNL